MIISENIKSFRMKKNYTQQELASLMNISRQSISKWETGKSLPVNFSFIWQYFNK